MLGRFGIDCVHNTLNVFVNTINFFFDWPHSGAYLLTHDSLCVGHKGLLVVGKNLLYLVDKTCPVVTIGLGLFSSNDDARFNTLIVERVLNLANKSAFHLNGLLRTGLHHLCKYVTNNGNYEIQKNNRVNKHKNDPNDPGNIN